MVLSFELYFSVYLNNFCIKFDKFKQLRLVKICCKIRITYSGWPQNLESWKNLEFDNLGK